MPGPFPWHPSGPTSWPLTHRQDMISLPAGWVPFQAETWVHFHAESTNGHTLCCRTLHAELHNHPRPAQHCASRARGAPPTALSRGHIHMLTDREPGLRLGGCNAPHVDAAGCPAAPRSRCLRVRSSIAESGRDVGYRHRPTDRDGRCVSVQCATGYACCVRFGSAGRGRDWGRRCEGLKRYDSGARSGAGQCARTHAVYLRPGQ